MRLTKYNKEFDKCLLRGFSLMSLFWPKNTYMLTTRWHLAGGQPNRIRRIWQGLNYQSNFHFPYRAENLWSKSHNMGIKTEWTTTLFDQNDDCDKFWHNTILEFRCWRLPIRNCVVGESPCEGKYQSILRCITCNRIYFLLILLARNQPDKLKFALYVKSICFEIERK